MPKRRLQIRPELSRLIIPPTRVRLLKVDRQTGQDRPIRRVAWCSAQLAEAVISAGPWYISSSGYPVNGRGQFMHRLIVGLLDRRLIGRTEHVEHINGDRLDNRTANLHLGHLLKSIKARPVMDGVGERRDGSWYANWKRPGERRHWRFFATMEEAVECRTAYNQSMIATANTDAAAQGSVPEGDCRAA